MASDSVPSDQGSDQDNDLDQVIGFDKLRECERDCRKLARSHYENFVVASVLLPKRLRQPFYNIYAFCRTADDLADQSPSPETALQKLADFQNQLDATFAGRPPENLFLPLWHTIRQFDLPKQPLDDLLSAFRQDQTKTQYDSQDDLLDYCRQSANPVGRILLRVANCFDDQTQPFPTKYAPDCSS